MSSKVVGLDMIVGDENLEFRFWDWLLCILKSSVWWKLYKDCKSEFSTADHGRTSKKSVE